MAIEISTKLLEEAGGSLKGRRSRSYFVRQKLEDGTLGPARVRVWTDRPTPQVLVEVRDKIQNAFPSPLPPVVLEVGPGWRVNE